MSVAMARDLACRLRAIGLQLPDIAVQTLVADTEHPNQGKSRLASDA